MEESAKEIISELNIPEHLWEDAIREIWFAERDGRDVRAWLKYWLEQKELEENGEEFIQFIDPDILDQRAWEEDNGLHYDQYHGYVRDDV